MGKHDKDCECCDELSPLAKGTLDQIDLLMSGIQGAIQVNVPGFNTNTPQSAQVDVINTLTSLNASLGGQISDIIKLTEYFYSLNFANVKLQNLKVDNPNKKFGKFKLKDISDNPSIDISKFLDFKMFDISKFKKLKISLTVPTLIIEKSISIGPVSVGIKFMISLLEVTWMPAVSVDFDSIKKALAALKDSATKQKKIVGPSAGKSIGKLKEIANKQFADAPDVFAMLVPLKTPEEFFKVLEDKGLNLTEEIDVSEEAEQILADADLGKQLANTKLLDDIGIPIADIDKILKDLSSGKTSMADLGTMELCPKKVPAKPKVPSFSEEEIAAVTQCAVDLKSLEVPELIDTPEVAELENLLNEAEAMIASDPQKLIDDMNDFLAEVDKHNKEMQVCSKDKEDAKNKSYSYKQAYILHDFVHKYLSKRYNATKPETLNAPYIAFYKERDRLTTLLSKQLSDKSILVSSLPIPPATSGVISTPQSNPQLIALDASISTTQSDLAILTAKFENTRSEFEAGLKADLHKASITSEDTFTQRLSAIHEMMSAETNPISNLVGFDDSKMSFVLYADSDIIKELKEIEIDAKSSGATMLFKNYFRPNIYGFRPDPTNILSFKFLRKGVIEDIWRVYYSANRIDYLFTWKEQGYTAPKPVYDDEGKVVGKMTKVAFTNGQGIKTIQEVPQSVKDCGVDTEVAIPFLEKLEENTEARIDKLINDALNGPAVKAYVNKILFYAELEAKIKYSDFLFSLNFNENQNIFNTNTPLEFAQSYKISQAIYDALSEKANITLKTIEKCKTCIAKKKKNIAEAGAAFAKVAGVDKPGSDSIEKICKKKKGSDPFGVKQSSGECPDQTKNCYWKEYTKLLQTVSLMPIPDTQFLYQRLFRYYPVPLQIPIAPLVLPTLASGIPDVTISIPLPFLWIHLLSIQTPLGLFVMWLGMAGGFIPNPYIMLIDEKMQSSFILTPKGITPIPAHQLLITPPEGQSLLDLLPAFETTFKLDMSVFGKLLAGSTRGDSDDPDSAKNVIKEIKDKIKKSLDGIEIADPFWSRDNERARPVKAKIKKAMEFTLPEADIPTTIKEAMDGVLEIANKAIDKMDIPPYKIPKNSKGMMFELPNFLEIKATVDKLSAAAKNGPADLVKKVMGDIGKSLSVLDVNKDIDKRIRTAMEKPKVKAKLVETNQKIDDLEASLSISASFDDPESQAAVAAKAEAIKKRTKAIKDLVLIPVQEVADSITPEMLGFLAYADSVPPLPFPCYTSISLPAIPPQVAAIIAAIKALPGIIKAIPDDAISKLLLGIIDLSASLPSAEDLFYLVINPILTKVPRLIIPTGFKQNLMKIVIKAVKDFILLFKVRLPKAGLPTQITIPASLIKSIIKTAVKVAFGVLVGVLLNYVNEILQKLGPEKIMAILAFLAVIKLIFGTDLHKVKGKDIKAFLTTVITSAVYPALDEVKPIIDTANAVKAGFKSIMEMFTLPDPLSLLKKDGPFFELQTKDIKKFVDPILYQVVPVIAAALPFPVVLLAASTTPGRLALSKIDPRKAIDKLPPWEGLSLKNIPLLLFLDQLAATAQRTALLQSDYIPPYFTPVTP